MGASEDIRGSEDRDALVVLAARDRAALGRVLRVLQPHVRRAVRSRLRRGPRGIDADDVVQEATVRIIESFPRFVPPETARFEALTRWAAGIARQTARHAQDRARASTASDADMLDALEDGGADVVDEVLASERGRVVREAIGRLREPWRTALVMRFLAHASMKEIATRLGRPTEGAARQLVQRAMKALRERLRGPTGWPCWRRACWLAVT